MVDWLGLLINTLWILGLSLVLAGLCIKSYLKLLAPTTRALHTQERAHISLGRSAPLVLRVGPILFCGSLLCLSTTTWERAVWALALVLTIKNLASHLRATARTPGPSSNLVHEE
jgi:hypothetical protein